MWDVAENVSCLLCFALGHFIYYWVKEILDGLGTGIPIRKLTERL